MTIRLHPATPHGNRLHLFAGRTLGSDPRVALTVCGIVFVWGDWKGERRPLPRCAGCFA